MKTVAVDVCNFSVSETEFKRTGIQEVIYKTCIYMARMRHMFPDTRFILLPHLPTVIPGVGHIPHPTINQPHLLRQIENELQMTSADLWGFDLAGKYNYKMSYNDIMEILQHCNFLHLQSLCSINPLLADLTTRLPHLKDRISCTVYDLVPYLYPEYCNEGMPEWYTTKYLSGLAKYVPYPIGISRHTAVDMRDFLGQDPKYKVYYLQLPLEQAIIGNSIEAENLIGKYSLSKGGFICHLGSVEPRKNFVNLLEGFRLYKLHNDSPLKLVFIGGTGWKNEIFAKLISDPLIQNDVVCTGYLVDAEVTTLISSSGGLVMPSYYEGYGLPAAMGYMAGVPVITSYVSSLPEAVNDEAVFIDPDDPWSIATAMKSVSMRTGQKDFYRESFNWLDYVRKLMELLASLAPK